MEHPAQFQQLFSEFQQSYLAAEGQSDLAAYIEIRNSAYHNINLLRERMADGEDCTDLILRKLLPYTDTTNNRWLGAWTHVAAAVPGDIRRWYGAAGRTGQEDWPIVADAIWRFVDGALDMPEQPEKSEHLGESGQSEPLNHLIDACASFSQLAVTKGFQMGMLTPILNALHPDRFHLVNSRTRHVLQYFTGTSYSPALTDYPNANRGVHDFLAHVTAQIAPFAESGTYPGDLFERFCYWLTVIRRYSLKPSRCWLVAAGEDAWQWEEWKDGGFVAVGWDELGDLSDIKKAEFIRRRDSLLAQYDGWTKKGTELAWRFARQLQEGDQIAVFSAGQNDGQSSGQSIAQSTAQSTGQYLLGYGTVVGSYYYAPELPQGHRVPIQWEDLQTRQLPDIAVPRSLMELTPQQFQELQQSPIQSEPTAILVNNKATPLFVDCFAPILEALRDALPEGRSTAQLVAALTPPQGLTSDDSPIQPASPELTASLLTASQIERAIHRARHYLSKAGLIESQRRGQWRVTAYGAAISLGEAEMGRIYQEVEYRRRVEESLLHESSIIRRLTESATSYTVGNASQYDVQYNAPYDHQAHDEPYGTNRDPSTTERDPVRHGTMEAAAEEAATLANGAVQYAEGVEPALSTKVSQPYSLVDCAAESGVDEAELTRWVGTLLRKQQIILSGPSGTGKTYMAQHLARHLTGGTGGFWELVQFHPGYAYEDFVQGLRPNTGNDSIDSARSSTKNSTKNSSTPLFTMKPGRFLEFCQRAEACQGPAVLIIDEINRANLARVFGEVMYLLEYRDAEAILAGNGAHFRIPQNVYLIGTMNTADRSISLIDHALRRRFGFIELAPNYDLLRHYHRRHETNFDVEPLIRLLVQINQSIGNPHQSLGVTYFLSPTLMTDLRDIWQTEIEPTLAERFFDAPEQMEPFRWQAVEGIGR